MFRWKIPEYYEFVRLLILSSTRKVQDGVLAERPFAMDSGKQPIPTPVAWLILLVEI